MAAKCTELNPIFPEVEKCRKNELITLLFSNTNLKFPLTVFIFVQAIPNISTKK
jgi:hypothetical protein